MKSRYCNKTSGDAAIQKKVVSGLCKIEEERQFDNRGNDPRSLLSQDSFSHDGCTDKRSKANCHPELRQYDYLTSYRWLACWTANREVRGSNPGQDRNLVRDFCSTCAP